MKRISYISDLHLDFHVPFHMNQMKWEDRTKDFIYGLISSHKDSNQSGQVLVIAGDISHFNQQSLWALEEFAENFERVVFTYGNHDLYFVSKNQAAKYKRGSYNRVRELKEESSKIANVIPLFEGETHSYRGVNFAGLSMWYPLETPEQQMFFHNISNDSKLINGLDVKGIHQLDRERYEKLLEKEVDVMITHFPVINVDSHFKYNSTACYLTPVKDIKVKHWVSGHVHEQKVYEKPYCNFYFNSQGYPDEKLELGIKSFKL